MNDLITWLRAQLDEEERRLRQLDDVQNYPKAILWRPANENNPAVMSIEVNGLKTYRRYWDPEHSGQPNDWGWNAKNGVELFSMEQARERLAEIDARRRIIELHAERTGNWLTAGLCRQCQEQYVPCATVRLLALPYADRLGYREEWRP